ncbi:unnamed protein product, partial [Heterosigma akashiwo]
MRLAMVLPRLYLGTMTFGWSGQTSSIVDQAVSNQMTQQFIDALSEGGASVAHVDTARIYAGGETEPMVGEALQQIMDADQRSMVLLGTKAHPSQPGGLSPDGIRAQLAASLEALKVDAVHEYYLHQPDPEHSLLESLRCLDSLVEEGRVREIGLSNYHADEVARAFALCEEHGLRKPSVYQGLYNPLNRAVEEELLPTLRAHGCAFVAYNPLAAGLLTGAHSAGNTGDAVPAGRFRGNPNYLPRFYTPANFAAAEACAAACRAAGLGPVEGAYRWLRRHSALGAADGLLAAHELAGAVGEPTLRARAARGRRKEATRRRRCGRRSTGRGRRRTRGAARFHYWRRMADMPGREG